MTRNVLELINFISLLLRHSECGREDFGRLMIDVERRAGTQRSSSHTQLMKLFYLDYWNNCHRINCDDRFNCRCQGNRSDDFDIDRAFFISDRECIDLSWLCDGIPDCSGGEDEVDCVCSDDEFQCNVCERDDECDDGIPWNQCIDESRVRDGRTWWDSRAGSNCWNGNDELVRYLKVIKLFNVNNISFTSSQIFKNPNPNSYKSRVTSLFQLYDQNQ